MSYREDRKGIGFYALFQSQSDSIQHEVANLSICNQRKDPVPLARYLGRVLHA